MTYNLYGPSNLKSNIFMHGSAPELTHVHMNHGFFGERERGFLNPIIFIQEGTPNPVIYFRSRNHFFIRNIREAKQISMENHVGSHYLPGNHWICRSPLIRLPFILDQRKIRMTNPTV